MQDKFSRIVQIFLRFANVKHNWKIQKLKNIFFWKIAEKLAHLLAGEFEKLAPLLARSHVKLKNRPVFGTPWHVGIHLTHWHDDRFISTFAQKKQKLGRFYHVSMWASGYVDHTGTHRMRFRRLGKDIQLYSSDMGLHSL